MIKKLEKYEQWEFVKDVKAKLEELLTMKVNVKQEATKGTTMPSKRLNKLIGVAKPNEEMEGDDEFRDPNQNDFKC